MAIKLGIITEEERFSGVISGEDLRAEISDLFKDFTDEDTGKTRKVFKDNNAKRTFKGISEKANAIYRATAEDKLLFISGLSETSCAAVTGQAISDIQAMNSANVGFGMGINGCSVIQDEADILILDDNFVSIFNAVRWGRNVFDNCRKFIQYQMTVNLSCLWIVILGGATLGISPFSILQLLWINLIMDVLAAIALASEAPHPTQLRKERVNLKKDSLISPVMMRNVLS